MAAKEAKIVERYKIAQVVWTQATIGPTTTETISWPTNTMLLIIATSVPRPRACFRGTVSPSRIRNWGITEWIYYKDYVYSNKMILKVAQLLTQFFAWYLATNINGIVKIVPYRIPAEVLKTSTPHFVGHKPSISIPIP